LAQPRKLRWFSDVITYNVQPAPETEVNPSLAEQAIHASFRAWEEEEGCEGPGFMSGGTTKAATAAYLDGEGATNENGVYWITQASKWPHGQDVLALTTLTYSTCTGQIVDADIEINAAFFNMSAAPNPGANKVDVQNTITHEVGHFLGMDHSLDLAATMYAQAPNGETRKRSLAQDDINGLCCIYQSESPTVLPDAVCEGAPASVDESGGGLDSGGDGTSGCNSASASYLGALGALGMSLRIARRRRKALSVRP
jgi:hypothetical protein